MLAGHKQAEKLERILEDNKNATPTSDFDGYIKIIGALAFINETVALLKNVSDKHDVPDVDLLIHHFENVRDKEYL